MTRQRVVLVAGADSIDFLRAATASFIYNLATHTTETLAMESEGAVKAIAVLLSRDFDQVQLSTSTSPVFTK